MTERLTETELLSTDLKTPPTARAAWERPQLHKLDLSGAEANGGSVNDNAFGLS